MRPEDTLQAAVVKAARDLGLLPVKIHNEGMRSPREGSRLKRLGLCPGAADLAIIDKRGGVLWLELKAGKNPLTDYQKWFRSEMGYRGQQYIVARSLDEAVAYLHTWRQKAA